MRVRPTQHSGKAYTRLQRDTQRTAVSTKLDKLLVCAVEPPRSPQHQWTESDVPTKYIPVLGQSLRLRQGVSATRFASYGRERV